MLDNKKALRLRLLAEEMICMLPQLLIYGKGKFWIENEGSSYELHLSVTPYDMSASDRDKILSVSKSGKNAAAVGIIGKIVNAVEIMIANNAKPDPDTTLAAEDRGVGGLGIFMVKKSMDDAAQYIPTLSRAHRV